MLLELAFAIALIRLAQTLPLNSPLLPEYDYISKSQQREMEIHTYKRQSLAAVLLALRSPVVSPKIQMLVCSYSRPGLRI